MLQISFIKENKELVIAGLKKKYYKNPEQDIETALRLDEKRRSLQVELDNTLAESKNIAKSIGMLMKQGKKEEAEEAKSKTSSLKQQEKELKEALNSCADELQEALVHFPNVPHESVPTGKTEDDNLVVYTSENKVSLEENNKLPHWDLIKKYDIVDFELGNTITGAGFPVYKGKGARLQRSLINFFLDEAVKAGYGEVQPPIFVNEESAYATGQLPDKEGQMYHMPKDNLYVIPTAEVPITNMYRDTIIKESELPIKNVGFTPCFRREAGSWGAHVRGLNRLHQFDKVEIVQIQHPSKSYETLEEMKAHVIGLLEKLELPYRVLNLCGGDVSFASALTFDMEVFSAAQERWLEVSSVSNFETFQANRLKLRFKGEDKKSHLLHTLNGSALALPRILASIIENNQTPKGIKIPKVLIPYTGFDIID